MDTLNPAHQEPSHRAPQCSAGSSFARSDVSNFSSCDGHLEFLLLSGESQILETFSCHMTGPTVANAEFARKPELRSVCAEMLHPGLLLVAGSSPWHAGGLLSWGPVRSTRGAELNDYRITERVQATYCYYLS